MKDVAPSLHLGVVATEKGVYGSLSTTFGQLIYNMFIYDRIYLIIYDIVIYKIYSFIYDRLIYEIFKIQ